MPYLDQNRWFFKASDPQIWGMTLTNSRAPLLCYLKLCATFRSHWWIQTRVIVRQRPIWAKIDDFINRVTLKCDGWPWKKTRRHLLSSINLLYHFIFICEFKLELWSEKAKLGFDIITPYLHSARPVYYSHYISSVNSLTAPRPSPKTTQ